MYRRRGSKEKEEVVERDSSSDAFRDSNENNNRKGVFRKSSSCEPGGNSSKHHRKKSFTAFFSNLFGTKIPENRNSGISTRSSSFESVNTILSSNSFSFVSPKKYKGKHRGKRIPVMEEQQPTKKRNIGTLTRLGMKIGLKSKYNLQSCESLHHLSYLDSACPCNSTTTNSNTGTLNSTIARRKKQAPLVPKQQSSSSPTQPSSSPIILQAHTTTTTISATNVIIEKNNDDDRCVVKASKTSSPINSSHSTAAAPVAGFSGAMGGNGPFKITAKHRRCSSEGSSHQSPHKSTLNTNTMTNTYRKKAHIRGKRRAPVPPNPFGDPDAPEFTTNETIGEQVSPVSSNPFEEIDATLTLTNETVEAVHKDLRVLMTVASQSKSRQGEIDEETRTQLIQLKREADTSPLMLLKPKTDSKNHNDHFNYNFHNHNGSLNPPSPEVSRNSCSSLTSPPLSPVATSSSLAANGPSSPCSIMSSSSSSFAVVTPTVSPGGSSPFGDPLMASTPPSKISPRPWYKRNSSSSSKKTKQLIKPLSSMTKFSDIDREAARIVEERRSAEQSHSETARELITMFNAFNRSQLSVTNHSDLADNDANETIENAANTSVDSARTGSSPPTLFLSTSTIPATTTTVPSSSLPAAASGFNSITQTSTTDSSEVAASSTSSVKTTTSKTGAITSTTAQVSPLTVELPRNLAIVQPQSNFRIPTSTPQLVNGKDIKYHRETATTAAASSASTISVPISSALVGTRKEDWSCPRCTLKNSHWRTTCDACFFKIDSSVQKLSSVFETGSSSTTTPSTPTSSQPVQLVATVETPSSSSMASSSKPVKSFTASTTENKFVPLIQKSSKTDRYNVPFCENFLGQFQAKDNTNILTKESKPVGKKLLKESTGDNEDFDLDEEVDIVKLREARLAFFDNVSSSSHSKENEPCAQVNDEDKKVSHYHHPAKTSESNNLALDDDRSSYNINHNNIQADKKEKLGKKNLNVFTDDEDDSIDALLQMSVPNIKSINTTTTTNIPPKENNEDSNSSSNSINMPNFSGPRTWNPLHSNRFRPILESILEASNDIYLRVDPIYENWNLSQAVNTNSNGYSNDDDSSKSTWANTFMQMHEFPHNLSNSYYANSNSDSSSCSEHEPAMDGKNRAPSRRHSSHHHHRTATRNIATELTLEDYRKLGAIPKNWRESDDPDTRPNDNGASSQRHEDKNHRSHRDHDNNYHEFNNDGLSMGDDDGRPSNDRSCFGNTFAVSKLLRKLEWAIANGEHRLAASLASDLAVLKINCVVAKGGQKSSPITIRVYVEDRFMQQGPFHVQVTPQLTVKELKEKIQKDWSIPSVFQKWILGRKIAEDDTQILSEFDVVHDSMAFLYLVTPHLEENLPNSENSSTTSLPKPQQQQQKQQLLPTMTSDKNSNTFVQTGPPPHPPLLANKKVPGNSQLKQENDEKIKPPPSSETVTVKNKPTSLPLAVSPPRPLQTKKQFPANTQQKQENNDEAINSLVITVKSQHKSPQATSALPEKKKVSATDSVPKQENDVKSTNSIVTEVKTQNTSIQVSPPPLLAKKKLPVNSEPKHQNDEKIKPPPPSEVLTAKSRQISSPPPPAMNPPIKSEVQVTSQTKQVNDKVPNSIVLAVKNQASTPPPVSPPRSLQAKKKLPVNSQPKKENDDKMIQTAEVVAVTPQPASPLPKKMVSPPKQENDVKGINPVVVEVKNQNVSPQQSPPPPPLLAKKTPPVISQLKQQNNEKIQLPSSPSSSSSEVLTVKHEPPSPSPVSPPRPLQAKKKLPGVNTQEKQENEVKILNSSVVAVTNNQQHTSRAASPLPTKELPTNSQPTQENNKNVVETLLTTETVKNEDPSPAPPASPPAVTTPKTYLRMLEIMEQSDIIHNEEEFECLVCLSTVPQKEGVVLRDCLHSFCKDCLIGSIQHAEDPQVKCPFRDDKYSCQSPIQEREIKALLTPELFEKYLSQSVKIAEGAIINTYHCKTADCCGWCVFEDDVNVFKCPVCNKENCLNCRAIHETMNCQEYQRQLAIESETDENAKSSRLMLEKMIQKGEALECPGCHVVLLKKWGCEFVRCSYCKTEICWITKGFRWGPAGKGDTSGGCKCGVNGIRCHPKCSYCH